MTFLTSSIYRLDLAFGPQIKIETRVTFFHVLKDLKTKKQILRVGLKQPHGFRRVNIIYVHFHRLMSRVYDTTDLFKHFFFIFLGAWWLGFIINGIPTFIFSIPLIFFPRVMTVQAKEESHDIKAEIIDSDKLQDIPRITDILNTNDEEKGGLVQILRG